MRCGKYREPEKDITQRHNPYEIGLCLSVVCKFIIDFIGWFLFNVINLYHVSILYYLLFEGSIYFTLAITVERYTTVCHPFFKVHKH